MARTARGSLALHDAVEIAFTVNGIHVHKTGPLGVARGTPVRIACRNSSNRRHRCMWPIHWGVPHVGSTASLSGVAQYRHKLVNGSRIYNRVKTYSKIPLSLPSACHTSALSQLPSIYWKALVISAHLCKSSVGNVVEFATLTSFLHASSVVQLHT